MTSLAEIRDFKPLLRWFSTELRWPIDEEEIDEDFERHVFDYSPEELGLREDKAASIREILQLRPFEYGQAWGLFFINFDKKTLPIGVLKRILGELTLKKRAGLGEKVWDKKDLLFVSLYGISGERELSLLYFKEEDVGGDEKKEGVGGDKGKRGKPVLKELGWGHRDTKLKMEYVENTLREKLTWPRTPEERKKWHEQWPAVFTSTYDGVIKTSKKLVERLVDLATSIRKEVQVVIKHEKDEGPLRKIYHSFQKVLFDNLTENDFADMYAQTICYGLLAARIQRSSGALVADDAAIIAPLTQPFLKDLMETFLAVGGRRSQIDFNHLGVDEVVETLKNADMDEVLRDFGQENRDKDPILYFYEDFLEDYDDIKRGSHGVYYTPLSVVKFIVRSVDEVLVKEFGLQDGLADTTTWGEMLERHPEMTLPKHARKDMHFVQILDPATGTGTFLIEVIDVIAERVKTKWVKEGKKEKERSVLWNAYVCEHLLPRLHGFELMMAPYAIAHIMIALKLYETGYAPQEDSPPRVRVYLTNALEEAKEYSKQQELSFPNKTLALEVKGANVIKMETPMTVVIGNPPYSVGSMNPSKKKNDERTWVGKLIQPYFYVDGKSLKDLGEKKVGNLNDDYVKFMRFAQWQIERTGKGIVSLITNHGWIDNITFRGMRESLVQGVDKLYILDLHGNVRKKERAPGGGKDESVFAIQQGTAIFVFVKYAVERQDVGNVFHADVWGLKEKKYKWLENNHIRKTEWQTLHPRSSFYFFVPRSDTFTSEYEQGWKITDIVKKYSSGVITRKDKLTIQWSKEDVHHTINKLVSLSEEEVREYFQLGPDTYNWKVPLAQKDLREKNEHNELYKHIVPILYRPFDTRYTWYSGKSNGFINRPLHEIMRHMLAGENIGLITSRQQPQHNTLWPSTLVGVSQNIIDIHCRSPQDYLFPLYLYDDDMIEGKKRSVNLQKDFVHALSQRINLPFTPTSPAHKNTFTPKDVLYYIYAILHSPTYRKRYAEYLKTDFPRIPLPCKGTFFRDLTQYGEKLINLHLLDPNTVPEVPILVHPDIRYIGTKSVCVGRLYPQYKNGKVMIADGCHFEDVTEDVWNFHVGGYQVCKKWLKDRAATGGTDPKPGRTLTDNDILYYCRLTVVVRETIRVMMEIDGVIHSYGGWPDAFSKKE